MKNLTILACTAVAAGLTVFVAMGNGDAGRAATTGSAAANDPKQKEEQMQKATFAAGCFWGVEAAFRELEGVTATRVGYIGGHTRNPTYKEVCNDNTGHAEAVELTYDPDRIGYGKLLATFWEIHNPTTPNRQGVDIGSQYRSAIFYHDDEQKQLAEKSKQQLAASGKYQHDIVTQIVPAVDFWEAEEYHQQYLEKRGRASCHAGLKQAAR